MSKNSAVKRAGVLRGWRAYACSRPQLDLALPPPTLPLAVQRALERMNPWWRGAAADAAPPVRRPFTRIVRRRLEAGLTRIVAVRGPRRVGKSTAQLQLVEDLLGEKVAPTSILRVQFDDLDSLRALDEPILRIVEWFEARVLRRGLNEAARAGHRVWLLLDEVQDLPSWSVQLKHLVDHSDVVVYVTGSSALRIEEGRDSLAGRLSMVEVGPMSLREIAEVAGVGALQVVLPDNGVQRLAERCTWEEAAVLGRDQRVMRDEAFALLSERGGYPIAHHRPAPWEDLAADLRQIVERTLEHDLRLGAGGRQRDVGLLNELFRVGCRYAGQSLSSKKVKEEIRFTHPDVKDALVTEYFSFLDAALLLRQLRPLEALGRAPKALPRLMVSDLGVRRAVLGERVPLHRDDGADPVAAGHLAENVLAVALWGMLTELSWSPERPGRPEVDLVLTVGAARVPIEVKYRGEVRPTDLAGLRSILDGGLRAPFGVLVTRDDEVKLPEVGPDIVVLPLSSALLLA
jgi:predicted AAA+ superfamily ATPase